MKSKVTIILAVALLLAVPALVGAQGVYIDHDDYDDYKEYNYYNDNDHFVIKGFNSWEIGDARFKIDRRDIVIMNIYDRDEFIRITEEHELFVNDERITLDDNQQEMLIEFYNLTFEIKTEAKFIAKEGAKIGVSGAKLGLKALGYAVKMLFTSYTEDDMERDIEAEAELLEERGEELEEMAERIEELAEDWERVGLRLKREVPELDELDWLDSDKRYRRRSYGRSRLD